MKRKKPAPDHPTPLTNRLVEKLLCADGIPKCKEWDALLKHAREMERRAYCYKVVAAAAMGEKP